MSGFGDRIIEFVSVWRRLRRSLGHPKERSREFQFARAHLTPGVRCESTVISQVGLLTIAWSSMEMTLGIVIHLIHRNGGSDIIRPDLPSTLSEKLEYLSSIENVNKFKPYSQSIKILVSSINKSNNARHELTNGVINFTDVSRSIPVIRYRFIGDRIIVKRSKVSLNAIGSAANDVIKLSGQVAELGCTLASILGKHELEQALHQLAGNSAGSQAQISPSLERASDPTSTPSIRVAIA